MRLPRPAADLHELVRGPMIGQQRHHLLLRDPQPAEAEVVGAALDQHRLEVVGHDRLQERNVLVDELLLQADRVRRDDDLAS